MKNLEAANDYIRRYGGYLWIDRIILRLQYLSILGSVNIRWKLPLNQGALIHACRKVRDYNQDIYRPLPELVG